MAAYAAVVSLQHTINGLLKSSSSRVSSIREILESADKEASSLLQVLEALNGSNRSRSSMERVDALEAQIRDSAHKLEDVLEFHELKQLEEEEEEEGDEEGVMREEIRSFGEAAKRLEKEYLAELSGEDDVDDEDATYPDFGVEMIGRSALFNTILQRHVLFRMRPDDRYIVVFSGEEGSGVRLVVETLFKNAQEAGKYERWGWARVGRGYELKHVLMSLIAQVDESYVDDESLADASDNRLNEYLYKALENQSYLIVLDGVDDVKLLDYLSTTSFPDQSNGSLVLVTTTSQELAGSCDFSFNNAISDVYEEDIWLLMRHRLFRWESIPAELETAGKGIVHNCRCLYISLAKTLVFLSKSDKTVEQWSKIAADKDNPIFTVVDEILEKSEIHKEIVHYCEGGLAKLASEWADLPHQVESINTAMYPERFFSKIQIISFFGMAGIGKTIFAKNIFDNQSTFGCFNYHVWIHTGPRYQTKEILIDIIAQIYPHIPKVQLNGDEELVEGLCAQVSKKKCLIVLDDLCSQDPLDHLREVFSIIKGTILVTTRLPKVAKFGRDDTTIEMQLLQEEESWCLLCRKVFDGGLCPPQLEKVGRKIAEKCDGLPLLILTVADQLCKVEQSEEYWNNVVSGKEKSVFKNAHHQISKALLPSYHNLPQHLKPCFLYLGVFLEKSDIPISNLTNLWISEGFLKTNLSRTKEDFVAKCLYELIDISLIMVRRNVSCSPVTKCRLHSVFWHLSNSQAVESKLFHAMNSFDDCSIESIASQRRLCIRDAILLSWKDVQKSMASNINVHSFLCVGPLHQYPVPLNFDLRLMRVLNALAIRFYEFPIEVTSLFHLRYLSLTCNGELPASISQLRKLQCLIVKRYMSIKSSKVSSYLPLEIWDMKELKHLQIMGGCLPNHRNGSGLLKLSTLLDVTAESCKEKILKWIPNLKRLGIRIELAPTDSSYAFPNLNDIYHIDKLESFKCVVVNPHMGSKIVPMPNLLPMFPPTLKKLSLSGLGYPWEHISKIGKLNNLEVLKLKCNAFQGPKWEMDSTNQFEKLKFLLLEDLNLVNWKLFGASHLKVEGLCIKHCYKLQKLPITLATKYILKKIEIVDCTPLLVTKAEEIGRSLRICEVNVHRSWL